MIEQTHFIGTWQLVSQIQIRSDGEQTYPRGEHSKGLLIYDATGWMSVQLMRRDRRPNEILADFKGAMEEYLGYYGTFTIDEEAQTVTHHIEGSSYPVWIGTNQVREFEFSGNTLTLTATLSYEEYTLKRVLVWVKV